MSVPPPVVVCFSGSDPSCGAGLQADLLALAAWGCHPATIVTTLTVKNAVGVTRLMPSPVELLRAQTACLIDDLPVAAFKIGLIGSTDHIDVLAEFLSRHPLGPVVLDPVLASGRGDPLLAEDARAALRERLLPYTTVLTPNTLELARLSGLPADTACERRAGARALIAAGSRHVLVTGTHARTDHVENVLFAADGREYAGIWPRLAHSFHGSGCTLAAALAAALAHGHAVPEAASMAQAYTYQALRHAYRPGHGQWIPDRLLGRRPALTHA